MSPPKQSRCAARIEFLMLRYQLAALLVTSVLLLSPLAIFPLIGGPVSSAIFASVTVALAFLAQWQIAKRLFMGPPASAALIRVARDTLPFACRAKFDHEVAGELEKWRTPLSAWRVVDLHRSLRRKWCNAHDSDVGIREQHLAAQIAEVRD
ncbi:hypothetical protein P8Q88_13415 [Qipengyuania sp. XHP0207]|uniref:hypothetical protein n=1 Tax=Qipengyuania sp. XHP0207 TaxID=3038078 RepID=UPI00241CEE14|nr:hypothetical protein [Qipengyuania sp. XHP0207]MDG5749174.1 hypothetical protein [Qipengyuania sp. XHP0207]